MHYTMVIAKNLLENHSDVLHFPYLIIQIFFGKIVVLHFKLAIFLIYVWRILNKNGDINSIYLNILT